MNAGSPAEPTVCHVSIACATLLVTAVTVSESNSMPARSTAVEVPDFITPPSGPTYIITSAPLAVSMQAKRCQFAGGLYPTGRKNAAELAADGMLMLPRSDTRPLGSLRNWQVCAPPPWLDDP